MEKEKAKKGEKIINFIEENHAAIAGSIAGGICCMIGYVIGSKYTDLCIARGLAKACEFTPELEPMLWEALKKAKETMKG